MIKPVVCDLDVLMTNVVNKSTAMQNRDRQIIKPVHLVVTRKLYKVDNWIIPFVKNVQQIDNL